MKYLQMLAVGAALFSAGPALCDEWTQARTLSVPGYNLLNLATTPSGDVVAGTFYNKNNEGNAQLPVVLIHKPLSDTPSFHVVCMNEFPKFRGYSGVAVDRDGYYYAAADTGDPNTCWIRRFAPNGQRDMAFGISGQISMGQRLIGLDLVNKYLITTAAWGELLIFDAKTGKRIGNKKYVGTASAPFIRDIAADPASQTIYGVAKGAVWAWRGGTFDNPAGYKLEKLSDETDTERVNEGIYFDAFNSKLILQDYKGGQVYSVSNGKIVDRSTVSQPSSVPTLSDAVLLFDGLSLFVSDVSTGKIYVMKRSGELAQSIVNIPSLSAATGVGPGTAPAPAANRTPVSATPSAPGTPETGGGFTWMGNYNDAQAMARQQSQPLLVFFASSESKRSREFEQSFLQSSEFKAIAPKFVNCYFDVQKDRLQAQQLGVFRVPQVGLYTSTGERVAVFTGEIDTAAVLREMNKLGGLR